MALLNALRIVDWESDVGVTGHPDESVYRGRFKGGYKEVDKDRQL